MVIVFLSACSPVKETTIPKEETGLEASSSIMKATNDGRKIRLAFTPVSGARTYALTIGASDEKIILSPVLKDGTYSAVTDIGKARSSAIAITFYASPSLEPEDDWVELFTVNAPYERAPIDEIAPEAVATRTDRTSAEITIINAPESCMRNRVTV